MVLQSNNWFYVLLDSTTPLYFMYTIILQYRLTHGLQGSLIPLLFYVHHDSSFVLKVNDVPAVPI